MQTALCIALAHGTSHTQSLLKATRTKIISLNLLGPFYVLDIPTNNIEQPQILISRCVLLTTAQ